MSEKSTTAGASPENLAGLFGVCPGEKDGREPPDPTEAKEHLLRWVLAGALPGQGELQKSLPAMADQLHPLGRRPLGEVLLDAGTPLEAIQEIKSHGKRLAAGTRPEEEHSVAVTVYFAAIASAMLFHGKKITSHSWPALAEHFDGLAGKTWMAPELAGHFARARELCRARER